MFETTQAIYDELSQNSGRYHIEFINASDSNDTAVRAFDLVTVSPNKRGQLLKALNTLNCKYRYVKFTLNQENGINLEYDYPFSGSHPEESALEMVIRLTKIVDDAYPELMHAMWS